MKYLPALAGIFALALVACGATYFFYCPCDRTPGGWLLGPEVEGQIADWSFVNDAGLCQIQVSGVLPHSVNLNCMAARGDLYLSCASCEGKTWSTYALEDPAARIRIAGKVYAVSLRRVETDEELDRAWIARAAKLGREAGPRRPGWWSFGVSSR